MKGWIAFAFAVTTAAAQQGGVSSAVVKEAVRSDALVELTDEIELVGRQSEACAITALGSDGVQYLVVDGERRADWMQVVRLRTARPVSLVLANGDRATAKLVGVDENRLKLESDSFGAIAVGLSSLTPLPQPAEQDDPAKPKTPLTPGPWKGSVSLAGSFRAGNSDQVLVALRAAAEKNWEYDKLSLALEALYGKSDGAETNKSIFAKGRLDHFWSDRFYGYAQVDALYDKIQDLDLRAIGSLGVGYMVWKANDDRLFSVEGGFSGIYTSYGQGGNDFSPAARAAATYKEILFKDVRFSQDVEFLLPLDDVDAFLVRARTALAVPVAEGWSMKMSLDANYTASPAVNRKPWDIMVLVGIEYQF